jgi:hypothetical protein
LHDQSMIHADVMVVNIKTKYEKRDAATIISSYLSKSCIATSKHCSK